MYELYYSPGACSMAIHAVLNELGQAVTLHSASIPEGKNKTPEFLKLNSRGSVPVLVDDGVVIREGGAQLVYLMEKHKSPLLPAAGKERAKALEWLMFCNSTLHPAYARAFGVAFSGAEKSAQDFFMKQAIERINFLWNDANTYLEGKTYLCGDQISGADFLMAVIANWNKYFPDQITLGKNVERVIKTVVARPSFQKALQAENVEYKAAA